MNSLQTPIVPRKARTSVKVLQGPQLMILSTLDSSGRRPSMVQRCPKTVISGAHRNDLKPENVPPLVFIRLTTRFKSWKCSQTKRLIPEFSGIVSYSPEG